MNEHPGRSEISFMTREQVRAFDAYAINELAVPGVVLMENAGRSCSEAIKKRLAGINRPKVCIFCGTGNNGGDGYVIARHLFNVGIEVVVVICGEEAKIRGDAKINLEILKRLGQPFEILDLDAGDMPQKISSLSRGKHLLVDAILGTGLKGHLNEPCRRLIDTINMLGIPVFAVDIPSGLDCDTGEPLGAAIIAERTMTFVANKKGFVISKKSLDYTGTITVASIGVVPEFGSYRKWASESVGLNEKVE